MVKRKFRSESSFSAFRELKFRPPCGSKKSDALLRNGYRGALRIGEKNAGPPRGPDRSVVGRGRWSGRAGDKPDYQDDYSRDQQDVEPAAKGIRRYEAEEPKYKEDDRNREQHLVSFCLTFQTSPRLNEPTMGSNPEVPGMVAVQSKAPVRPALWVR